MTSRRRKREGDDYEAFRDVAEKGMYENAGDFHRWLVGHYQDAQVPAKCLTALVAALYGRLARQGIDCDFEPEELAELFDKTVTAVDLAGSRYKQIHVTEVGTLGSIGAYELEGASAGAGTLTWRKHVEQTAADIAHDMMVEAHHCEEGA